MGYKSEWLKRRVAKENAPGALRLSDWRSETAADLKDAESRLVALESSLSGDPTEEQLSSIWRAFVDVEKSIAFIRVELDSENPGLFVNKKVYRVPDERQAVVFALGNLRRGAQSFVSGNLEISLRQLRESRNYLRVLIIEKRRPGGKRKGAAAPA